MSRYHDLLSRKTKPLDRYGVFSRTTDGDFAMVASLDKRSEAMTVARQFREAGHADIRVRLVRVTASLEGHEIVMKAEIVPDCEPVKRPRRDEPALPAPTIIDVPKEQEEES